MVEVVVQVVEAAEVRVVKQGDLVKGVRMENLVLVKEQVEEVEVGLLVALVKEVEVAKVEVGVEEAEV